MKPFLDFLGVKVGRGETGMARTKKMQGGGKQKLRKRSKSSLSLSLEFSSKP